MSSQAFFFASIAFSLVAWGTVTANYLWPRLRQLQPSEALRPILMLHMFRFLGLSFLIPGVASADLPSVFARSAAYGDLVAATLACLTLILLPRAIGLGLAWLFNLWGSVDILNAFYQANSGGLVPGELGATYFIPTLFVPLLLITHALGFRILWRHRAAAPWRATGAAQS